MRHEVDPSVIGLENMETNIFSLVSYVNPQKFLGVLILPIPHHFPLVLGVGTQGGNLKDVAKYGMNADCGYWHVNLVSLKKCGCCVA
jgi:hypothetical protein